MDIFRKKLNISDKKKIFLFQGSIVPNRGIEDVLDAFSEIENFHLVVLGFSGDGPESRLLFARLTELSKTKKNIHYLPAVKSKDLLSYTSSADYGLCLTRDTCLNHKYSLPNKFFEYLSVHIPVMVSNLPEMSRIVQEYRCGAVCRGLNKCSIKDAINEINRMNYSILCNGASRVASDFDWEKQENKLIAIYSKF
jgi:glycosyltransferase involved in cell wall biosynthesis